MDNLAFLTPNMNWPLCLMAVLTMGDNACRKGHRQTHNTEKHTHTPFSGSHIHTAGVVYWVAIKRNVVWNESSVTYSVLEAVFSLEMKEWTRPQCHVFIKNFYLSLIFQLYRWASARPDPPITRSNKMCNPWRTTCACVTENTMF